MPRSAVKVSKSPEAYVREKDKTATDLEKRLAACSSKDDKDQNKANQIRVPLCETLSDIILTSPAYALSKDVTGRLWRHCFYSRIGPNRSRIQKEKRPQQRKKLQDNLMLFLCEGVTLYEYLDEKLLAKLANDNDNNNDDKASGADADNTESSSWQTSVVSNSPNNSNNNNSSNSSTQGIVECLHRLLIHKGDLHRYSQQLAQAEQAYLTASLLGPGMGHPYNQLAVVNQVKDQNAGTTGGGGATTAVALYWYCRSLLAAVEVFETSHTNMKRLLKQNQTWLLQKQDSVAIVVPETGKSAQSRRFLAVFLNLQYLLLQGVHVSNDDTDNGNDKVTGAIDTMIGQAQALLKNSVLGDSLLCKLVTIGAFFQCHVLSSVASTAASDAAVPLATIVAARTSNLRMGTCLLDRVQFGLQKKVPSTRLLLPLLLLSEFVAHHGLPSQAASEVDGSLLQAHDVADAEFWTKYCEIFNTLQTLAATVMPQLNVVANDGQVVAATEIEEYQNLRGYKPFEAFIPAVSESGYLNDDQAIQVLQDSQNPKKIERTQESGSVASVATGSNVTQKTAAAVDQSRAKILRFLYLGRQLVTMEAFASRVRLIDNGKQLEWMDDAVMDDDDDDVNSFGTEEPVAMDEEKSAKDASVLVFQETAGGGPALLVPGAFLQGPASGSPAAMDTGVPGTASGADAFGFKPIASNTVPMDVAPLVSSILPEFLATAPAANLAPVDLPLAPSLSVSAAPAHASPLVNLPPPASMLPPPGFGVPAPSNATPQLPPGFAASMSMLPNQTERVPTLGESLHLFGGSSALQTANPFATLPAAGSNTTGLFGSYAQNSTLNPDDLFGQDDALGPDGAALLDSSLLNSLWMDDSSPRKSKNPFAT